MKIKTVKKNRFSTSVILGSTKVLFDKDGIAEVDDSIIKSIIEADPELEVLDSKKSNIEDSNIEYRKELLNMKKDDILKLASESSLPEQEYIALNKEKLVDYLISKL